MSQPETSLLGAMPAGVPTGGGDAPGVTGTLLKEASQAGRSSASKGWGLTLLSPCATPGAQR